MRRGFKYICSSVRVIFYTLAGFILLEGEGSSDCIGDDDIRYHHICMNRRSIFSLHPSPLGGLSSPLSGHFEVLKVLFNALSMWEFND